MSVMLVALVLAAAPLPPVAELPGPLVIVGGGKMPDAARDRFFNFAGRDKAHIVVIPTASAAADDPAERDSFLAPWQKLTPAAVTILHTRDRKTADDPAFAKSLADATGVWFSGGDQSKLTAAYAGTAVEVELKKLHARGGVIGGTSAGAAVLTTPMITGGTTTATTAAGFNLLPGFVADQHFVKRNRHDRLVGVLDANPGFVGLGIDEGTAVIARGRTLTCVGESTATVILSPGAGKPRLEQVLKAGDVADLFQLRRAAANRALKDSFPPAKPADCVVPKGTLVIVGGGGAGPEIWGAFVAAAGGPDAVIVVVPTSMEDPLPPTVGEARALERAGAKTVKVLHTRDRKTADDPAFSEVLKTAGGVWFGGGRHWRFADSYEGTLAETRFREVLTRGGAIGGSSAGASIQAEFMPRGHPLGNSVMAAEGYERGFGYLPGAAVDQHFFARKRTADMTGLMKQYPQYLGIGIDEGTAIVVTKTTAKVIGKSKVAFYDPRTPAKPGGVDYVEVKAGESYDLKGRAKGE